MSPGTLEVERNVREQSEVVHWRFETLRRAGFSHEHAHALAARGDVDLHRAVALVRRGCPPDIAYRILA